VADGGVAAPPARCVAFYVTATRHAVRARDTAYSQVASTQRDAVHAIEQRFQRAWDSVDDWERTWNDLVAKLRAESAALVGDDE
jgi:hypothetical protein